MEFNKLPVCGKSPRRGERKHAEPNFTAGDDPEHAESELARGWRDAVTAHVLACVRKRSNSSTNTKVRGTQGGIETDGGTGMRASRSRA
ncbi:unnamed protein product [Urochloa humidicola]